MEEVRGDVCCFLASLVSRFCGNPLDGCARTVLEQMSSSVRTQVASRPQDHEQRARDTCCSVAALCELDDHQAVSPKLCMARTHAVTAMCTGPCCVGRSARAGGVRSFWVS